MKISLIAALGIDTRVIGKENGIPWRIKDDMVRFRNLTMGHFCLMGRKTYETMLPHFHKEFLPGRRSIIISSDSSYTAPGCFTVRHLESALLMAEEQDENELFILGGGEIYHQMLHRADRLYLTLVHSHAKGDVFFPEYQDQFGLEVEKLHVGTGDPPYTFLTLDR